MLYTKEPKPEASVLVPVHHWSKFPEPQFLAAKREGLDSVYQRFLPTLLSAHTSTCKFLT